MPVAAAASQSRISLWYRLAALSRSGLPAEIRKMPEVGPFGPNQRNRRFEFGPLRQPGRLSRFSPRLGPRKARLCGSFFT